MRNRYLVITVLLVLMMVVAGCSNNSSSNNKVLQKEILVFSSTEGSTKGDLYIIKENGERDKLASNMNSGQFLFFDNTKTLLYLDSDNNLYIKLKDKESEKLTSDVAPGSIMVSEDESTFVFLKGSGSDLYIQKIGKEREKVASNIGQWDYDLSKDGEIVTYIDNEGNLYSRKSDGSKEKLASSVWVFRKSLKGDTVAFLNNSDTFYTRNIKEQENKKINAKGVSNVKISEDGKTIFYLADYNNNSHKGELYIIKDNQDPKKVASDVTSYDINRTSDMVYYINSDNSLFLRDIKKEQSEKISSDIDNFLLNIEGNTIAYLNNDGQLFLKQSKKEVERASSDVRLYSILSDRVIYTTNSDDLYEKKFGMEALKIASNVSDFVASRNYTSYVYYNDNHELFIKVGDSEIKKAIGDMNEYTQIYLLNGLVFEKALRIKDIVGIWQTSYGDVVEITKEGKAISYYADDKYETTINLESISPTQGYLNITDEYGDEDYLTIELVDKNTIVADGSLTMKKITREELNQKLQQQREEQAKQAALDAKIDKAYEIAYEIEYSYIDIPAGVQCRVEPYPNAKVLGTLTEDGSFWVEETYVDEEGELWFEIGIYHNNTYRYVWINHKDI